MTLGSVCKQGRVSQSRSRGRQPGMLAQRGQCPALVWLLLLHTVSGQ
jgi:hypothetical protein